MVLSAEHGNGADDAALAKTQRLFVRPLYLKLLNANFLSDTEDDDGTFPALLTLAATAISNQQLQLLLDDENWRTRLTASWLIGLSGRKAFVSKLSKLLAHSRASKDIQGYAVALGILGGPTAKRALVDYLARHLPCDGYDGHEAWVLAALAHIEGRPRDKFMNPDMWSSAGEHRSPIAGLGTFAAIIRYVERHQLVAKFRE